MVFGEKQNINPETFWQRDTGTLRRQHLFQNFISEKSQKDKVRRTSPREKFKMKPFEILGARLLPRPEFLVNLTHFHSQVGRCVNSAKTLEVVMCGTERGIGRAIKK